MIRALNPFDLEVLETPVRSDLPEAFGKTWGHIVAPGPGWSSAQRVAIAEEARRAETCALCLDRKAAVSPNAVGGDHDCGDVLPEAAIEAVHRISTDAGRLTKTFYEQTLSAGITDSQWIEFIGIISSLKSIDSFYRALGLPAEPLPTPHEAEATGYRPEGLTMSGGWAPMIREKDLGEPEKMLYGGFDETGNVIRAMSLVPDEVRNLSRLSDAMYLKPFEIGDFKAPGNRKIDRMQIELIAARVSSLNECFY